MTKFIRTVETAKAYKDIVDHARELGFEPVKHSALGSWEDDDGETVFLDMIEPKKVAQKYFTVDVDGQDALVRPVRASSDVLEDGALTVTFSDR